MAKMRLDFTESQRILAPEDEYSLRFKEKTIKNSAAGKPMVEISWLPFDSESGISAESLEKVILKDWISLQPNALFSLKNLMLACGVTCECVGCGNKYSAKLEVCDKCQSAMFEVDLDFIDTSSPRAFVTITKDRSGENDVNQIKKYIAQ